MLSNNLHWNFYFFYILQEGRFILTHSDWTVVRDFINYFRHSARKLNKTTAWKLRERSLREKIRGQRLAARFNVSSPFDSFSKLRGGRNVLNNGDDALIKMHSLDFSRRRFFFSRSDHRHACYRLCP